MLSWVERGVSFTALGPGLASMISNKIISRYGEKVQCRKIFTPSNEVFSLKFLSAIKFAYILSAAFVEYHVHSGTMHASSIAKYRSIRTTYPGHSLQITHLAGRYWRKYFNLAGVHGFSKLCLVINEACKLSHSIRSMVSWYMYIWKFPCTHILRL